VCSYFKCKNLVNRSSPACSRFSAAEFNQGLVKEAGDELRQAYQLLSQVVEEDLIDYAVFTVKAAEKRYSFLLKKLKEEEKQKSWAAEGGET
jgi:hypothetical protein